MVDKEIESQQALILVVDDEPLNIFVVEEMLKAKSIACESATSGNEALSKI